MLQESYSCHNSPSDANQLDTHCNTHSSTTSSPLFTPHNMIIDLECHAIHPAEPPLCRQAWDPRWTPVISSTLLPATTESSLDEHLFDNQMDTDEPMGSLLFSSRVAKRLRSSGEDATRTPTALEYESRTLMGSVHVRPLSTRPDTHNTLPPIPDLFAGDAVVGTKRRHTALDSPVSPPHQRLKQ
ncbi:hypothetical protein OE88DRAFT_1656174 [Heliocybe sulcata]|uniref:Uncharacterized protein n=1 Tax=Heliocybe sulcata TaxID=5364 RepID=A0A5C3N8Y7_9AGAM|nr:hypothetical protein OE88DRAFT_1656174 [Heliocybe sulcata]